MISHRPHDQPPAASWEYTSLVANESILREVPVAPPSDLPRAHPEIDVTSADPIVGHLVAYGRGEGEELAAADRDRY